ncbi:unnamed protein product [Phytophthora fragariaefolia]|uniref:Unnamed protein product n=1 Tax=Phytophthora fragariaefolia TaxID=1490495 RepID=A0A9W6XYE2_9STRA|nr:unnamed protein product [Phytophthora fragariaefolia]
MRGDPAVSQRLQQAAEQLQAAIRSARKRRKSRDDVGESPGGKSWRLAPMVMLAPEREECDALKDEDKSDTDREQQQGLDNEVDSVGTSLASGSILHSPLKEESAVRRAEVVQENTLGSDSVEQDMRKALEWMQRDVERQARENRAVRENLVRAVLDITDVIADFVSPDAASVLVHVAAVATGTASQETDNNAVAPVLRPDRVDELIVQWEDALVSWREQNLIERQELMGALTTLEEEHVSRMEADKASYREQLIHETNAQQSKFCKMLVLLLLIQCWD